MAWHRPRYKMSHLIVLVAVLSAEFAILPMSFAMGVVALTLLSVAGASVAGPLSKVEWAAIVAIHALLIALLAPAVKHSHGRQPMAPATTTGPPSGKI